MLQTLEITWQIWNDNVRSGGKLVNSNVPCETRAFSLRKHQGWLGRNYISLCRWQHMGVVKTQAPADAHVPEQRCLSHSGTHPSYRKICILNPKTLKMRLQQAREAEACCFQIKEVNVTHVCNFSWLFPPAIGPVSFTHIPLDTELICSTSN